MKRLSWAWLLVAGLVTGAPAKQIDNPWQNVRKLMASTDFAHQIGRSGSRGWQAEHRHSKPGYLLSALPEPLLLEHGLYRMNFTVRRGKYPRKGLLHPTYGVFRLEAWDLTSNERIVHRDIQVADFPGPNQFERRWIEFSMEGREGHVVEPRVFWYGLVNGEIDSVVVERYPDPDLREISEKADRLADRLELRHLENGLVVSRKLNGESDEIGDAATYTAFYTASLAWKFAVTRDALVEQALENSIEALHGLIKGTPEHPILTRYVDADGIPFDKSPSKDVYMSFFFAYATAYPHIKNPALKKRMEKDAELLANRFLKDGLTIKQGPHHIMSLTPYFTDDEVRHGIKKLLSKPSVHKNLMKKLRIAEALVPFGQLWPGFAATRAALKRKDEQRLYELTVPTLNGALTIAQRLRDILREQYRSDFLLKRQTGRNYPGQQLEAVLTQILKQFPEQKSGRRFDRLSDLRVLASNALISLHIVKSAGTITKSPQFGEYYRSNLYGQDALLKTALDWDGFDEKLGRLTVGNASADRSRRGYLGPLALYNLFQREENQAVRKSYQELIQRWWDFYRHEDNPLAAALVAACGGPATNRDFVLRALQEYPENRSGFGKDHWKQNGTVLATEWGGGAADGYSREPLPISLRPKDSFLWQRNARRLGGDDLKEYSGTDYLFLYWLARYHQLIPAPAPITQVAK